MILAIFALITWSIICIFTILPKSLNLSENIILYFLLNMSSTLSATLISLNLHLLEINQTLHVFYCFWLIRTIAYPLIVLGGINQFLLYKNITAKTVAVVIMLAASVCIEVLSNKTGVVTFTGWNTFFYIILVSVIFTFYLGMAKLLRKIK